LSSAVDVGAGAVAWSVPAELATKPTYALLLFIIYIYINGSRPKREPNWTTIIISYPMTHSHAHTRARCIHYTLYYERDTVRFMRQFFNFFPVHSFLSRSIYIYIYILSLLLYCTKCAISARARRPSWALLNRIRNYIIIIYNIYYRYRRRRLDG